MKSNSVLRRSIRKSLLVSGATAIGTLIGSSYGSITYAAEEMSGKQLDEVIVTGSRIKRVQSEGSLPVQVFTETEIVRSGTTSVTDFVQQIPAMQGFTSVSESVGGTGGGTTTASIHDVGEQYTLVLLNGRRVAPATSGTTIDLNSIPLVAIKRIDVLTDGASAVYGADAIAGVVNFVLKQGEAPLEINARVSTPEREGGEEVNFSVSKGFGNFAVDGYAAFIAASYDKIKPLKASQREFSKTGIITGRKGDLNYEFFNGSSRSVPPNADVYFTDPDVDSIHLNPYLLANGKCPSAHVIIDDGFGEQCFFDYASTIEIAPQVERAAIYASGKIGLGSSGWSLFSDLAYTNVGTLSRIASYPAEFLLDTSTASYTNNILPYLTPAQASMVDLVNVKYRLYDIGNRAEKYDTTSLHFVGGVEGSLIGWSVSSAFTASTQNQDQEYLEGWPLADEFNAAISSGAIDPFPYEKGTMPADQLQILKSTQFMGLYDNTKIAMYGIDLNAQRELFELAGGQFAISFGADYMDNSYKKTPQPVAANAEILFDDPQPFINLSRGSFGAYSEVLAPITKQVELSAAVRFDQFTGVSDDINHTTFGSSEDATTFKLSGKWQPLSSFAFRASYGTGFRVASMREIAQPKIDFGVTGGTYNCPFSASYDPLGYIAAGYVCPNKLQYEMFQGGNPNLKPEKSDQWNVGLIYQPLTNLSIGINFWSVSIEDAVSSVSEALVMENAAKYLSLYTTKYKSSNGLTYVAIVDQPINIGKLENQGIDWDVSYTLELGFGSWQNKLAGTYLSKSRYTVPGTDDQWTTSLNKYGINDEVSFRNFITLSSTLMYGSWEHTLTVRYRNGYQDVQFSEDDCVFYTDASDCAAGGLDVPSYTTVNWHSRWQIIKNVAVELGIDNVMDKDPPRSLRSATSHQLGYDPRYASPYGRTFILSANFKY